LADIAKAVLSGAWDLVVGWILPSAVALAGFGVVLLPELSSVPLLGAVDAAAPESQALILLVAAVVLGVGMSAARTPLYRVLEGYYVWPAPVRAWRQRVHRDRRTALEREFGRAAGENGRLDPIAARAVEKYRRYPASDDQVLPTVLGNAMRHLEYYAEDHYQLDSQLLWQHLRGAVPELLSKPIDRTRTGVDFFICLCYLSALLAVASVVVAAVRPDPALVTLLVTAGASAAVAAGSYWGAVIAVDSLSAAVRAMVDLGRHPLAASLGLQVPATLAEERQMWQAVGWLVGFPYHEQAAALIAPWRTPPQAAGG